MKTTLMKTFCLLALLLVLGACGKGGTSSAKLEVSNGFLVSNAGFDGGLIVYGKSSGGEEFSLDIVAGVETTLELKKGLWSIRAVGWDGGAVPYLKFGGISYCGRSDINLDQDSQTIELSVSQARCFSDDSFASAGFIDASNVGSPKFKVMDQIITCNTFFDHSAAITSATPISSVAFKNSTNQAFCTSGAGMPQDLQSQVEGIKIYALNKMPGQGETVGSSTNCLNTKLQAGRVSPASATPSAYTSAWAMRLPSKAPFVIETFGDTSCTKPIAALPFKLGFENRSSDFDHIFTNRIAPTNSVALVLPANKIKKALSPFAHLLPKLNCDATMGGKCPVIPNVTPNQFLAFVGGTSSFVDTNEIACPAGVTVSPEGTVTCSTTTNGIIYSLTAGATGDHVITTSSPSRTYNVLVSNNTTFDAVEKPLIYRKLIEAMGSNDSTFPKSFFRFQTDNNSSDEQYGILSMARDMFGGDGPGGLMGLADPALTDPALTFGTACQNTTGTKQVTLYEKEELKYKTYTVSIGSSVKLSSPYTCVNSDENALAAACPKVYYDKELLVFEQGQSLIYPIIEIHFNCDESIGTLTQNEMNLHEGVPEHSQRLINWNTQLLGTQRFEFAERNRRYVNNSLVFDGRKLGRAKKIANDQYEMWNYEFNSEFKSSTWSQSMTSNQIRSSSISSVCYDFTSYTGSNPSLLDDILTNASPGVSSIRATVPNLSIALYGFSLNTAWNSQVSSSAGCSSFSSQPSNNGLINGAFNFNLDALNSVGTFFP